jgi:hypothetical protein
MNKQCIHVWLDAAKVQYVKDYLKILKLQIKHVIMY